jgi:hypothetical protein
LVARQGDHILRGLPRCRVYRVELRVGGLTLKQLQRPGEGASVYGILEITPSDKDEARLHHDGEKREQRREAEHPQQGRQATLIMTQVS